MPHDVTVMGAGVFGLAVAFACAHRGALVQVVDPRGVGAGASGGVVGALAPHVPENWNSKKAFQFESLRMAARYWQDVEKLSGVDPGYGRTGRVQPLPDDAAVSLAEARAETARDLWEGFADWSVKPVAILDGLPFASPTGLVIHDTLSARINPARACAALARAIEALGGIVTDDLTTPSGPVVWATGYEGLSELKSTSGRVAGNGVKGQAVLLDYAAPDAPQLFIDGVHFVPHSDRTLAVGSTSERDFEDPVGTDSQLDELLARARVLCPVLADAPVLSRWAGVRPRARSRAPMLGAHPTRAGAFIANGGFKIGFGMAPNVGAVMADLVLDGDDSGIPEAFRPEASL